MKRFFIIAATLLFALTATAQSQPTSSVPALQVNTHYLSNGMKVILVEEHSQPKIYGSVIVHAGAKNEDPNATGVAHYFEHIMFKGTDRIGTTDWQHEKPYLDSISDLYDRMQATPDEGQRQQLQLEINRLNIAASKYAIANETSAILQQMGCTELNAFTNCDITCYHNTLPSNQLENWMKVYAERFRNPVYRLFQSELEAVYEERNMYANEMLHDIFNAAYCEAFGTHPYSREVIGLDEHLKCPQPSAMKRFYDKYYVASNMTLLLVGDFNSQQALQMAERYFSVLVKGAPVEEPTYPLPTFDSQLVKNVKLTPVKAGALIFPGVKLRHPDGVVLNVISGLISSGNGYLDQLGHSGKVYQAWTVRHDLIDAGLNAIAYVPRIVGQKHQSAEAYIWGVLDSIKQGTFSDKQLQSVKMSSLISRQQQLEDYISIAKLLQRLEANGSNYEEWLREGEQLQQITRDDIMRVARRYYDPAHCTILRSFRGSAKKSAAIKPAWKHLDAQNQNVSSDFARSIAANKPAPIQPQVVDFATAATILPVTPHCNLYASRNPRNNLFSLSIHYHYGNIDDYRITQAVNYFNLLGADSLTHEQFVTELDCLGGSFWISSDNDYSAIYIKGPEENRDEIISLALRKLRHPRHDRQQLDNIVDDMQTTRRATRNDAQIWTSALYNYVILGENSRYLHRASIKEVKHLDVDTLLALIGRLYGRDGYITYVGNADPAQLADLLHREGLVREEVNVMPERIHPLVAHPDNAVYYCTNKHFIKSDIDFQILSSLVDHPADLPSQLLFNEYMNGSMNSIFFQEIREFRSLGYSTGGFFVYDLLGRRPGFYYGSLGTQCDKTNDGIAAMLDIMLQFPERPDRFQRAQDFLISERNSNYITFRSLPDQIRYWREIEKVDHDPRAEVTRQIGQLTYDDLKAFHKKYIAGRPAVIIISGNAKKFDLKALEQYGQIKEVKYKEMIKY